MIIYESKVKDFIIKTKNKHQLVAEIRTNLFNKFGIRVSESEQRSWGQSLPQVAKLIYEVENDNRIILIEFNIPCSKKRIDFVILGKKMDYFNKKEIPTALILELKQWTNITEQEWNIFKVGKYTDSHPSFQADDYKIRIENQMGLLNKVDIKAFSYLHNLKDKNSILLDKNNYGDILNKVKLYMQGDEKILSKEIEEQTKIKEGKIAQEYFKDMKWSPTKKFKELVKEDFKSIQLIGTQKLIYKKICKFIKENNFNKKTTFLISGDPGSGKTIVAFKILNLIVSELGINIQMMIPGKEVRSAFKYNLYKKILSSNISGANMRKGYDAAIIDEGHKAIGRDTGLINYENNYKKLNFAIILIDDDQVINKKGITSKEVKEIAKRNGHKVFEYNVEENFRNNGERTLIDWIDHTFYRRNTTNGDREYQQEKYINKNQNYKLYGYKEAKDFTNSYFDFRQKNESTRITSLWSSGFYLGEPDKDGMPKPTLFIGEEGFIWNPNEEWRKKVKKNIFKNYSKYIKKYSAAGRNFLLGQKHEKPKERFIAYFNHIQGFEFENIFVYIPNIFTFKNNEIIFHRERLAKEVKKSQTWAPNSNAKSLNKRDPLSLNKRYFINRLKVMLTRGTKSTHIFAQDKKLNNYIFDKIK